MRGEKKRHDIILYYSIGPCHAHTAYPACTHTEEPGMIKELEEASRLSSSRPQGQFMRGMEIRVNLSFQLLSTYLNGGSLLLMAVDWCRKSLRIAS